MIPSFLTYVALLVLLPPAHNEERDKESVRQEKAVDQQVSWLSRYDIGNKHPKQFKLPGRLSEASGLAMTDDGRLFCHEDENGVVYEVDYTSGKVIKYFSVGKFTIRGDFEGIAIKGPTMYLVSSNGNILEFPEGRNKSWVPYTVYRTPLTSGNNVEGLTYDSETDCLLLACKWSPGKGYDGYKAVYEFSLKKKKLSKHPRFLISLAEVTKKSRGGRFNPSDIARHPVSGTFFIIAANGESIIEISRDGNLLAQQEIPKKVNPQPEGITFAPDLTMLICNDMDGGTGTLTLYPVQK